jgi:hypothetical protein
MLFALKGGNMRSIKTVLTFFLINIILISIANGEAIKDSNKLIESLTGVDAFEALKIGNEWREKNYAVRSSVDSEAVRFIFPDKKTISIPLPEDRMVVAIAPYINRTHR